MTLVIVGKGSDGSVKYLFRLSTPTLRQFELTERPQAKTILRLLAKGILEQPPTLLPAPEHDITPGQSSENLGVVGRFVR